MMQLSPIKVECYSGYKADELPLCFYWHDKKYEIVQIIDRWYQVEHSSYYPAANYFKVIVAGNDQFIIKHDVAKDEWYLVI